MSGKLVILAALLAVTALRAAAAGLNESYEDAASAAKAFKAASLERLKIWEASTDTAYSTTLGTQYRAEDVVRRQLIFVRANVTALSAAKDEEIFAESERKPCVQASKVCDALFDMRLARKNAADARSESARLRTELCHLRVELSHREPRARKVSAIRCNLMGPSL